MSFVYPEAFVLLVPLGWIWWRLDGRSVFRALIILLGIAVLAVPVLVLHKTGADVIVVVDRSASMPAAARDSVKELIGFAEKNRGKDDRLGIVTFGAKASVERIPDAKATFNDFTKTVETDASDIDAALAMALDIIGNDRAGRILLLSDGEYLGPDPVVRAAEAAARRTPIDFRAFVRPGFSDIAIDGLDLPHVLQQGEAFQFSAEVTSTHAKKVRLVLRRGTAVVTEGDVDLRVGRNRLHFRDRPPTAGVAEYTLEVQAGDDRVPENDRGRGVVQVEGDGPVLLLTHDGASGALGRALQATGRPIDVRAAKGATLDLDGLARYRAVVFENVAALDVGSPSLREIRRWVEDLGGGFLLTGGRRSFGFGGYRKSVLEPMLPVALESKKEKRKLANAVTFVLDRSGSMALPVSGGQTKMDLANRGTLAAIELLADNDLVSVIAVDSAPHVVQELTALGEAEGIIAKVRSIESGGGGIFTYTGLVAGARQLAEAEASTRHIVLFADAADAEEPGEYIELLSKFEGAGITVSVIALGTDKDPDAEFLKDVAKRGNGQIYFTDQAEELPQLFSLETVTMMKSAFVEGVTPTRAVPDLVRLGRLGDVAFPTIGGYNLTQLREGAGLGIVTDDDNAAPVLAFWQRGLGRVAAMTAEVDGKFSGELAAWPEYAMFFATVGNWLAGDEPPGSMAARARREGHRVTVTLDVDPERPDDKPKTPPVLVVVPADPRLPVQRLPMGQEGEFEWAARHELASGATAHHRVEVDGRMLRVNPVTLPYSPEFESRTGLAKGDDVLAELARRTGGRERLDVSGLFERHDTAPRYVSIVLPLTVLWLCLLVFEVAQRRLGLFAQARSAWEWRRSKTKERTLVRAAATVAPARPAAAAPPAESTDAEAAERLNRLRASDPLAAMREAKQRASRRTGAADRPPERDGSRTPP